MDFVVELVEFEPSDEQLRTVCAFLHCGKVEQEMDFVDHTLGEQMTVLKQEADAVIGTRNEQREIRDAKMVDFEEKLAALAEREQQLMNELQAVQDELAGGEVAFKKFCKESGLGLRDVEVKAKELERTLQEKQGEYQRGEDLNGLFVSLCESMTAKPNPVDEAQTYLNDLTELHELIGSIKNPRLLEKQKQNLKDLLAEFDAFVERHRSELSESAAFGNIAQEIALLRNEGKPASAVKKKKKEGHSSVVVSVVKAIYDYEIEEENELGFAEGEKIYVTRIHKSGWAKGYIDEQRSGVFPLSWTEPVQEEQEPEKIVPIPK
jgi:hypothetical protein